MSLMTFAHKGRPGGTLAHIGDVENGRACECFCVACREPLVAVQGGQMVWHFRHYAATECDNGTGAETALHAALKQVLMECQTPLWLPPLFIKQTGTFGDSSKAERRRYCDVPLQYFTAREEVSYPGFVADVVIDCGGKDLIVEVAVTHRVNDQKRKLIESLGIAAIELRVDKFDRTPNFDVLRKFIADKKSWKDGVWIHNPRKAEFEAEVRAKAVAVAKRKYGERVAELRRRAVAAAAEKAKAASEEAKAAVVEPVVRDVTSLPTPQPNETPGLIAWILSLFRGTANHGAR